MELLRRHMGYHWEPVGIMLSATILVLNLSLSCMYVQLLYSGKKF